jgi:hypothetical protein
MPNWCDNEVWITGNADELQELFNEASKPNERYDDPEHPIKFLMDNLVPMPTELRDTTAPQDKPNWYDWSLENWGTKWDLNQEYDETRVYYTEGDSEGGLNYLTAWAPNRDFWRTVSKRFPNLRIDLRYIEEGMFFIGQEIIQNGETLDEVYFNDVPTELCLTVGAVLDADGKIDWDESNLNLWDLFPLIKQEELV